MAKIARKTAVIFGGDAAAAPGGVSQFGSLAAASPNYSKDPAIIQALSNWLDGWAAAVIGGNSPALEDMNAAMYVLAYQIAYVLQQGIAEYDTDTVYYEDSYVSYNGQIFKSLTDDNQGNQPDTSPTEWEVSVPNVSYYQSTDTGTADAYAIALDGFVALSGGQMISFKVGAGNTNTGASTLAINGGTPIPLKDSLGNALTLGMLMEGNTYTFLSTETTLQLLDSPQNNVSVTLSANTNDFSPTGYNANTKQITILASHPIVLTGLAIKQKHRPITIINSSGAQVVLLDSNGQSASDNRFILPYRRLLILNPLSSITLSYNTIINKWVVCGTGQGAAIDSLNKREFFTNYTGQPNNAGIPMEDQDSGNSAPGAGYMEVTSGTLTGNTHIIRTLNKDLASVVQTYNVWGFHFENVSNAAIQLFLGMVDEDLTLDSTPFQAGEKGIGITGGTAVFGDNFLRISSNDGTSSGTQVVTAVELLDNTTYLIYIINWNSEYLVIINDIPYLITADVPPVFTGLFPWIAVKQTGATPKMIKLYSNFGEDY